MHRLIRKAARRDEQGQATPSASSASAAREAAADKPIDGPPPIPFSYGASPLSPGLDAAPNPILFVCYPASTIFCANPVTEATLAVSRRQLVEVLLHELFAGPSELTKMITTVTARRFDAKRRDISSDRLGHEPLHTHAVVGALDFASMPVLLELLPNEQKIRNEHEERLLDLIFTNKELIHSLAHRIKNPLDSIRGAAQLPEFELPKRPLREYTQIVIKGSGRLRTLVDRLLEPHQHPYIAGNVNIRGVLKYVRSVVLAEFPQGLHIVHDYDASLPEFCGDKE